MLIEFCLVVVLVLIALGVLGLLLKLDEDETRTPQEIIGDLFETKYQLPTIPDLNKPVKKKKRKSFRNRCKANTSSGRRCRNKGRYEGYCNIHAGHIITWPEPRSSTPEPRSSTPLNCKAETPTGSCQYLAIGKSGYCSHHSEVENIGLPTQEEYGKMIQLLENAIENRSVVGFVYYRGTSPGKRRDIIPEEIIHYDNGAVLVGGQCLLRKAGRNFNLTFMRSLSKGKSLGPEVDYKESKEKSTKKQPNLEEMEADWEKSRRRRKPRAKKKKKPEVLDDEQGYDLDFFKSRYNPYRYRFSDRKIDGVTVSNALEVISGVPYLCFSPITAAVFSWVHRNRKKVKGAYRKEIKKEIDANLRERVSYKYISDFILELYGNPNFDVRTVKNNQRDVKVAFKYSKKMLSRIVLTRKGISPQEATLEFKELPDFKKALKILETLEEKIEFLGNYKLRVCDKCRLVGVEEKWFRTYRRKNKTLYKKKCKICD